MVLDVEFGRIQARDMLQHLWTGPISNASVEVVQGSKSVEVRAVGVTKVIDILPYLNIFILFLLHWLVLQMLSYLKASYSFREQQLIEFWER